MPVLHVIGGGLSGLSAAVESVGATQVRLYESAPTCGGRARSFHDRALNRRIDNGNHLILSANAATFRFLGLIGARDGLNGPGHALFPWCDLVSNASWKVQINNGRIPFWAFQPDKRPPGMRLRDLRTVLRLLVSRQSDVVADKLGSDAFSRQLLAPFSVSALNTPCETASAHLLRQVVRECLLKGGAACTPFYPREGLSETFIMPAEAHLARMQAELHTACRVSALKVEDGLVTGIETGSETIALSAGDQVVLATPAPVALSLLRPHWPGVTAPEDFESIINVHFALEGPVSYRGDAGEAGFIGVNGGMTEWIYLKPDLLSVTISAANRYLARHQSAIVSQVWQEVRQVVQRFTAAELPRESPPSRVIIEKRATFAATVAQDQLRPRPKTPFKNLALAGDWTQTGLPSTIEGSIRSGVRAAKLLNDQRVFKSL